MMYFSGSTGGQYTSLSSSSLVGKNLATIFFFYKIINFIYQRPNIDCNHLNFAKVGMASSLKATSTGGVIRFYFNKEHRHIVHLVNNLASQDPGQRGEPRQLALLLRGRVRARQKVIGKRPKWPSWAPSDQISLTGLNDQQVITHHGYIFISKKIHVYWKKMIAVYFIPTTKKHTLAWSNCICESITSTAILCHGYLKLKARIPQQLLLRHTLFWVQSLRFDSKKSNVLVSTLKLPEGIPFLKGALSI